jgi:hypothetical protein
MVNRITAASADEGHIENVCAKGIYTTVMKKCTLDDEDGRDGQDSGCRPENDPGEGGAEQMT